MNKKFLREADNRVLRPQELPKAVMSEEERKREAVLAKKQGLSPLDCPVGVALILHSHSLANSIGGKSEKIYIAFVNNSSRVSCPPWFLFRMRSQDM